MNKGDSPFKPKKNWNGQPKKSGPGYTDKHGNVWTKDRSKHRGPHWDVKGPSIKGHMNVDGTGRILRQAGKVAIIIGVIGAVGVGIASGASGATSMGANC